MCVCVCVCVLLLVNAMTYNKDNRECGFMGTPVRECVRPISVPSMQFAHQIRTYVVMSGILGDVLSGVSFLGFPVCGLCGRWWDQYYSVVVLGEAGEVHKIP